MKNRMIRYEKISLMIQLTSLALIIFSAYSLDIFRIWSINIDKVEVIRFEEVFGGEAESIPAFGRKKENHSAFGGKKGNHSVFDEEQNDNSVRGIIRCTVSYTNIGAKTIFLDKCGFYIVSTGDIIYLKDNLDIGVVPSKKIVRNYNLEKIMDLPKNGVVFYFEDIFGKRYESEIF